MPQKVNKNFILLFFVFIFALVITFGITACNLISTEKTNLANLNSTVLNNSNLNLPVDLKPTATPKELKPAYILRRKLSNDNYENILTAYNISNNIVQWKSFLFYIDGNEQQIYRYDLDTNKKEAIYDLKTGVPNVNDLTLLNNTLYIQYGEFIGDGGILKMPLPDGKITQLYKGLNSMIINENERYWISSGNGDACYSTDYYHTFVPKTEKIGPKLVFGTECENGNPMLGFYEDYLLLGGEYKDYAYKNLYLINAVNGQKQVLLSGNNMPANMKNVFYDKLSGKLAMLNQEVKDIYVFNLADKNIQKIPLDQKLSEDIIYRRQNNTTCVMLEGGQILDIDLRTGITNKTNESCDGTILGEERANLEEIYVAMKNSLKLPADIELLRSN